jgi:pimeloyl-ACP methyl ester carboxylesterase
MANSKLLIPGTGGITLMDQAGKDLGYPVSMKIGVKVGMLSGMTPGRIFRLLAMEHKKGQIAPAKTSLLEGVSIRPGKAIKAAYNKIPNDFNHFLYDWRADMRYSAGQLLGFIKQRKPATGRWHLVGHSQGGLLIILASKLTGDPWEFRKYVASITFVASPIFGTVNAAYALVKGDQFGDSNSNAFVKTVRSWPSLYQMMPSWRSVVDSSGTVLPAELQITKEKCWEGHEGISPDLLKRAREAHKLLKNPFDHMEGDIKALIIMAKNRETKLNLVRTNNRLTARSLNLQMGDTLVPHDMTFKNLDALAKTFVLTKSGNTVAQHSMLCSDINVVQNIINVTQN